jgi:hypothetical protein
MASLSIVYVEESANDERDSSEIRSELVAGVEGEYREGGDELLRSYIFGSLAI